MGVLFLVICGSGGGSSSGMDHVSFYEELNASIPIAIYLPTGT